MGLAAAALVVLVFSSHDLWVTAAALAVMGLGLGLFTPANNASVAAAGHDHQAGMVSGVLNMTRGVGTSLGVALGAVAYSLANALGNSAGAPAVSGLGFRMAVALFAVLGAVAAVLSFLGRRARPKVVSGPKSPEPA